MVAQCVHSVNSDGMTFGLRWLNAQRGREKGKGTKSSDHLQGETDTTRSAPDAARVDERGGPEVVHRSIRKEPNRERKVGLIGCRRRNLVVSICHSVARERVPGPSPQPLWPNPLLYLPLYLHFSSSLRGSQFSQASPPPLRARHASVHSRGIYLWIRRSRRSARMLAGYYENSGVPSRPSWNSIHVSRRSRQKSHDCRRTAPSCRRAPLSPPPCSLAAPLNLGSERFDRFDNYASDKRNSKRN